MVLYTAELRRSNSLHKSLRKIERSWRGDGIWQVRFDTAFEAVMRACSAPRTVHGHSSVGTWITEEIIASYTDLHRRGHAHSSELWHAGRLVAGAYGVAIGRMFYGESMFTEVSDGSKIALTYLNHFLRQNDVVMIDCQQQTAHLASLGAVAIPRAKFLVHVANASVQAPITNWQPTALF